MSMTPIMRVLRRAIATARASADGAASASRRDALRTLAIGGAATMVPSWLTGCARPHDRPVSTAARIAIVGAGIAGMRTAHLLRNMPGGSALEIDVFEAAPRIGGRMYSVNDLLVRGVATEMGGEFIDTDHHEMLSMVSDFGLELVDLSRDPYASMNQVLFFDGRHYTEVDVVREIAPVLERIQQDMERLPADLSKLATSPAAALDMMSLESYFTSLGLTGWLRSFLDVAFVTENGLELGDQSALNLLTMISTDLSSGSFKPYGQSDERFKIRGGNQQLVQALARSVKDRIHVSHALERIAMVGDRYALTFRRDHTSVEVDADVVVLALPFTTLRDVRIDVELPQAKRRAINELRYGNNSKVVMSFATPFWHERGQNGLAFTDTMLQNVWDNTAMLGTGAAGLTVFNGGAMSRRIGSMTKEQAGAMLVDELAAVWPEIASHPPGRTERFDWTSYAYSKGSYSGYAAGQWTSMFGVEGRPVGRLFFAGEHCSMRYKGFMNGAAESAVVAANAIAKLLS
ncbi:MAG: FAD-dependent oxidoreductase [Candidatus Kapabacteria bacterium]|nr:FAD-dependent oxidoreductase [Candidatus Kapabacteria bacterium]